LSSPTLFRSPKSAEDRSSQYLPQAALAVVVPGRLRASALAKWLLPGTITTHSLPISAGPVLQPVYRAYRLDKIRLHNPFLARTGGPQSPGTPRRDPPPAENRV